MQQVIINRGNVSTQDIPAPTVEPGRVLVEVAYSLISSGTESNKVASSGKSIVKRIAEKPERVMQVIELVKSKGLRKTFAKVSDVVNVAAPSGYSCAGRVLQVGAGVTGVGVGDRVACAGAGIANHAEIVSIPQNLFVKVPAGCELHDAASVTLGAIAMQGVRQTEPQLGENIAVVGLGLIGQITIQLLTIAGSRVIAFDTDQRRVDLAKSTGIDAHVVPTVDVLAVTRDFSEGHGVDAVVVTAASTSDAIMQQAMHMARKKGRIIIVGAVGLGLERSPFYQKELDLRISCSYGPGRYDATYESEGLDYPYAYVRWTENRNMREYVRLLAEKRVRLDSIIESRYNIANAADAYEAVQTASPRPLGVLLEYDIDETTHSEQSSKKRSSRLELKSSRVGSHGPIRLAIVGTGHFMQSTHIPNLRTLSDTFKIDIVISRSGVNAKSVAQQLAARVATTDLEDAISDPNIDAVFIATRHHLHGKQVLEALKAGKHVFCEKPLALTEQELISIAAFYGTTIEDMPYEFAPKNVPLLMVGFNRRFAPGITRAMPMFEHRKSPLMAIYRVNAGFLANDHWVHGPEGGGRIAGEACHMLDLFDVIVRHAPVEATIQSLAASDDHRALGDNASITVRYADGSVCTLVYTALGHPSVSKEYVEVFVDGKTLVLDDFKTTTVSGHDIAPLKSSQSEKGHLEMLKAFGESLKNETWPVPLGSVFATSRLCLQVSSIANA